MSLRPAVIELVVSDLAASIAFYRRLGLELPEDGSAPHVEVELGGGLRLALDTVETIRSFDPGWTPPTGGHRVALAFACDSPADVDVNYRRLTDLGYAGHLAPFDAVWGQRYAVIHDPDGNPVDLFAATVSPDSAG
ncbi:VOC family protein [Angustibacter luteus]|uniref:VOC family protein n=1 Tax=Angustibacter luteus TaxID=658456 RepID=A0ABW1JD66_9ACTN